MQGPNSILVAMVMLLNIGLAIIFVHFLTWWCCFSGKFFFFSLDTFINQQKWIRSRWLHVFLKMNLPFLLMSRVSRAPQCVSQNVTSSQLNPNKLFYVAVKPWQPVQLHRRPWKVKMAPVRHGGGRRCLGISVTPKRIRRKASLPPTCHGPSLGPAPWISTPLASLKAEVKCRV